MFFFSFEEHFFSIYLLISQLSWSLQSINMGILCVSVSSSPSSSLIDLQVITYFFTIPFIIIENH
jgi:hypothetical protein